jgi:hypothetical protein
VTALRKVWSSTLVGEIATATVVSLVVTVTAIGLLRFMGFVL